MMPLLSLLVLAIWTFVLISVLGARATLRSRTFATFLTLGALMAAVVLPIVAKVFAPYGERGPLLDTLLALGWQLTLLAPVLAFLLTRARDRIVSVADAFLLAFMTGFGADLVGGVLAASIAPQPLGALVGLPPFVYESANPAFAVAGYGYWTALIVLAVVAVRRFVRQPQVAMIVGAALLLWVALDHAGALETAQTNKYPTGLLGLGYALTGHGKLPAWIALLALIGLSIWEAVWETRGTPTQGRGSFVFLKEWQTLARSLSGGVPGYLRLRALVGLRRQARIAHASLRADPGDAVLYEENARLDGRLQQAETVYAAGIAEPPPRQLPLLLIEQVLPWLALLLIVTFVLRRDAKSVQAFWDFPLFRLELPSLPLTMLNAILVGTIAWRYLSAAGRPAQPDEPDDAARFAGETVILQVALMMVLLTALAVNFTNLYPFPTVVGNLNRERLPPLTNVQIVTLVLLLATAATGLTRDRALRWRAAPVVERRAAGMHNLLVLAALFAITFVNRAIYLPSLQAVHQRYGPQLFNLGKHLTGVGLDGNSAAAIVVALFTGVIGVGVVFVLRWLIHRIEDFFVGPGTA